MTNIEVYRARSGWFVLALCAVFAAGMVYAVAVDGDAQSTVSACLFALAGVGAVYLLYVRPRVIVFDEGVTIVNPIVSITLGWQDVDVVDTRYAFSVQHEGKLIHAVAAPAPGRHHARTVHPTELKGITVPSVESLRPGDSPRSHSGVVAHLARTRLNAFQSGGIAGATKQVKLNRLGVALLAASLTLGLLLQLVHL